MGVRLTPLKNSIEKRTGGVRIVGGYVIPDVVQINFRSSGFMNFRHDSDT